MVQANDEGRASRKPGKSRGGRGEREEVSPLATVYIYRREPCTLSSPPHSLNVYRVSHIHMDVGIICACTLIERRQVVVSSGLRGDT